MKLIHYAGLLVGFTAVAYSWTFKAYEGIDSCSHAPNNNGRTRVFTGKGTTGCIALGQPAPSGVTCTSYNNDKEVGPCGAISGDSGGLGGFFKSVYVSHDGFSVTGYAGKSCAGRLAIGLSGADDACFQDTGEEDFNAFSVAPKAATS